MSGNDLDPPDPGENPAPESDGGQPSHINIDGSEGDISGQSDQPEAISCSLEGHGTVGGATEGSSDDPEGFQASVTVDPADSDGRWSAGNDIVPSADTESSIGAEGYPEGQCYESPNGIADTAANGPMGNDLEDEGVQDLDNDQTEDSLEGGLPYREGELVGGIQDSLSVHNYFESEGQNAEAENAEEDRGLFAGDEMPSWAAEHTASPAVEEDCAEADNLQNDNEARQVLESSAADENEIQENQLVVQADILHVPNGQHKTEESLSESDPEENAGVEIFCNDSVEADASQNVHLQENSCTADPEHELRVNALVSYGESSTENPSGQLETEQNEPLQREIGTENSVLLGSGASGSIPAVRSSIDDVQSVSSEILAGGENHENASFLGDTAHRTENSVCLGSGDEPEDSVSVEAAAILRNPASVDPDLCAPECDRPQTGSSPTVSEGRDSSELAEGGGDGCSVNSSVNDSECAHAGQAENRVTESVRDNVQGDGSHISLDSLRLSSQVSQNGPENISVPPCQQATGLLELEQVDLPSRCPGISGADLGDDFPRSADMLQSLTEGRDGFIDKAENSGDDCVILSTIKSETSANRDQIDAGSSTLHQRTLQGNETAYPEPNKEQATCFSAPHSVVEPEHSNSNNSSSEGREHSVLSGDSGIVVADKVTLNSSMVIMSNAAISVDDDLLSELDAELEPKSSKDNASSSGDIPEHTPHGPLNGMTVKPALCEISEEKLRILLTDLQSQMSEKESIIAKLENERSLHSEKLQYALYERDTYLKQLNSAKSKQQADDLYLPQIKELEYTINKQQNEIRGLKDKLSSHDASAKKVVGSMQNELKVRVDQVTKMYEECRKEKDSMVMKYAQAEHKNIELQKATEKAESRLREILREREMFLTKAKQLKADYQRTCSELETKCSELAVAAKELDKHRELVTSSEVRIKWAQNKMKAELDAHKETKKELEKINFRLKEAKEETEQIRRDTQAIIKTYQESEEMKSISLDQRLKKKETELLLEKREKTDQSEVHQAVMKELETLKVQYKDNLEELNTYKDKVRAQEAERLTNEETMTKYKDVLQTQKRDNRELQAKIDKMFHVQSDFDRAQDTIKSLDADIRDLKLSNKELQAELESCRKRESELLHLTKKLTEKNAHLQSENTIISGQMMNLNSDNQRKDMELQEFETKLRNASDSLEEEIKSRKLETEKLTESLKKKTKQTEDLSRQVDEQKDEIRTLKRRHANNIKDLTRQLQQARRKLENLEKGEKETVSMGSRTSSNGSLNTPQGDVNGVQTSVVPRVNVQPESPPQEYPVIVEQVEIDKEVLVNRIVKLQKAHARKNEKIEFMEDHINQLLAEVKKKKRIIQNYVMREEAGALSTENMDLNKMELSKRGGIMASVYSSHAADSHMNLELSLEINKKLQSVLEDTLLKNITLKENIDTLGEEIARLSQENRRLQLSIQGL